MKARVERLARMQNKVKLIQAPAQIIFNARKIRVKLAAAHIQRFVGSICYLPGKRGKIILRQRLLCAKAQRLALLRKIDRLRKRGYLFPIARIGRQAYLRVLLRALNRLVVYKNIADFQHAWSAFRRSPCAQQAQHHKQHNRNLKSLVHHAFSSRSLGYAQPADRGYYSIHLHSK